MAKLDLDELVLERGRHATPDSGLSVLEAITVVAPHEKFGDEPRNVSPVIAELLRSWNDLLDDEPRQKLKAYIPKVINSVLSEDVEDFRAWVATDWLVRVQSPIWLAAAGLGEFAEAIEAQDQIFGPDQARAAQKVLDEAAEAAHAEAKAGAQEWTDAGEAAWEKVGPKQWASAGNGIKMAVRDATTESTAPALAAAGWGARYAARDAAGEVAGDCAWDAAYMIAWKAALPVGGYRAGEASAAAREALAPVTETMHRVLFQLLDALIQTRWVPQELRDQIQTKDSGYVPAEGETGGL
ncbi:MAG: hypothetical protein WD602_03945 [Actinomycetota bacterium]